MESNVLMLSIACILLICKLLYNSKKAKHKNLPPSPPSLPVIGHLHILKPPVHRTLNNLSRKYGPIMSLKFGSRNVVIVSSSQAVEECFTKNDAVLANRPLLTMPKHFDYNYTTIAAAPYGDHWRNLRRIGALEIFAVRRINESSGIRQDEASHLLRKLSRLTSEDYFTKVVLKPMLTDLTFNSITRMVAGKRYYGDEVTDKEEAQQFQDVFAAIAKQVGGSNLDDFLPIVKWVTMGRFERKVKRLAKRTDKLLQGFVDEHRNKSSGVQLNTMIDHLLSLQESQPAYYTDVIIKGLVYNMLLAGTDTSAMTLEWAMSNLVNHPRVLVKAKQELESVVCQQRLVEETDLPNLGYLQSIIQETMRLYPVGPLLVPHYSSDDCIIGGYNVPRDTIIMVNAWAIHRDAAIWDDPTTFRPERFENDASAGEGKLSHEHKWMPFGTGRRACPGANIAQRLMGLTLGSLIQCFEWERVTEEHVDMSEGEGITMPKAVELEVMCKACPILKKVLL